MHECKKQYTGHFNKSLYNAYQSNYYLTRRVDREND